MLLSALLLHCRWSLADHQALGLRFSRRKPSGLVDLLEELHRAFRSVPSGRQLRLFFIDRGELLRGLRWKLVPELCRERRLTPTCMQPALEPCRNFDLPELPTVGSLIELFRLPAAVCEWLSRGSAEHYVVRAIAKRGVRNSKVPRIIEQPKRLLKAVQRDILREILRWVPAHAAAHGFVMRRSVISFTSEHLGQAAVLRMDLANFFPSIHAGRVSALFRSLGYPVPVTSLLTDLCTMRSTIDGLPELSLLTVEQRNRLASTYSRRHLPQGAPTSPALANLVAYRLDARLAGLARQAGCTYTRYADDLLFSGDRSWQRGAKSFCTQVAAIALDEGFSVAHHKTRLMTRSTRQIATGVVLNQHANIDRRAFDNLKATLTNCVRHGVASQNRSGVVNFRMHLLGRIAWVRQLNPGRADKLMRIFDKIVFT